MSSTDYFHPSVFSATDFQGYILKYVLIEDEF